MLVGTSRRLQSLGLPGCKLRAEAGRNLAEGLRLATASRLPLYHLEIQSNGFDSSVAMELVDALRGNNRLTELQHANNFFDNNALAALKRAQGEIRAAWLKTPEGKEAAKKMRGRAEEREGNVTTVVADMFAAFG